LRGASVVAYPSLDEGFGLPAFEALACGAPLVTTTDTPMAGVIGDAALLVPSGDVDALADALDTLLKGDPQLEVRRQAGLVRISGLTWEHSATLHAQAYRTATHAS
jgi:glycosyltransferase involved in cell wall biosynthesis